MPKQILKIDRFEGGTNDNSDHRDIADNELSGARGVMLDRLGRIRTMGGTTAHGTVQAQAVTINPGYGLFRFSHDRRGGHIAEPDLTGTHTPASDSATVLTDSSATWPVNGLVGATITNTGDNDSSGTVTENTATTATLDDLTGGGLDEWQQGKEMITLAANRDFSANTNWTEFSPDGSAPTIDVDGSSAPEYATINGSANWYREGIQLDTSKLSILDGANGAIQYKQEYLVSAKIWWNTSASAADDLSFYFGLGGTISDGFAVTGTSSPGSPFTATIKVVDVSVGLQIYNVIGDAQGGNNDWYVDDVSVKTIDTYKISAFPETGDHYLFSSDSDNAGIIYGYSDANDKWYATLTGLTNQTGGNRKDIFHVVDGVLRICDGEFGNTNTSKWYGYIKRNPFNQTADGTHRSIDRWCYEDQAIASPTKGIVRNEGGGIYGTAESDDGDLVELVDDSASWVAGTLDGNGWILASHTQDESHVIVAVVDGETTKLRVSGAAAATIGTTEPEAIRAAFATSLRSDIYYVAPPPGTGFNVSMNAQTGASSWDAGTYECASTFIYDNNQESLPFEMGGTFTLASGEFPYIKVVCSSTKATPFSARITGGRIYYRKSGTTNDWVMLVDLDLTEGQRGDLTKDYSSWTEVGASAGNYLRTDVFTTVSVGTELQKTGGNLLTYELLSGNTQDLKSITARYKTSVVAGRRVYIANLKLTGKDGLEVIRADAMIRSPVNKFDTFHVDNLIEASVQDGDEIVKLQEYADRILQFKKNKLHIINVSQDVEFLEDTFMHKGILIPEATCKTDFGIAWVNRFGCYLYDGKRVHNLLEKVGRSTLQVINQGTWESFTTDNSIITYIPKQRQIVVLKDCTASSDADIYLYDLVTKGWVSALGAADRFVDDTTHSNFVVDWNNDLIQAHSAAGTIIKWQDTSQAGSSTQLYTKDYDFGFPGVRKKIYKVYISYRGDGSTVQCTYITNGDNDGPVSNFYKSDATGASTNASSSIYPFHSSTVGTDDWVCAELKPAASINNIYSFRLIFEGTWPADFEINDISIVYRLKSIK